METVRVHYSSRQAMVKGVMTMTGDGWQVCGIATLADNCYRVEYARQVSTELVDNSDPAGPSAAHRERARQQSVQAARPR